MRKALLGLLLAATCVSLTGCGGCGGGLNEAQLRRRSRIRSPDELESAPVPVPPASPELPAQQETAAKPAKPSPAAKATPAPQATASAEPELTTADPMVPPRPTVGPIKVVVQNAKPDQPLTAEEKRQRSVEQLQRLGQALVAHAERTGALPANVRDEQGAPLLSWRVVLLPDLGYGELYRQFRLDEAWNRPHNRKLLAQIPPELQSPERFDQKTNYLGLAGAGQAFGNSRGAALSAMEDGPDNTVVVVEVDNDLAVDWDCSTDFQPVKDAPRGGIGRLRTDGVFALLGDGKVVRLGPELPEHQFLALFSPDGGEQIIGVKTLEEPTGQPVQIAAVAPVESRLPFSAPLPTEGGREPGATTPALPVASGAPSGGSGSPVSTPGAPADSGQIAVPPEAELAAARSLFRDLFGKQYEEARTWQEKEEFAQLLLGEANKIEVNPAQYYELLRIARDVAASGGDVTTGLKATELLAKRFQVDGLALRLKLLDELSKSPRKSESAETLKKEALQLLLDAFDTDNFDVALPAYERLVEFTRLKGDRTEISRLTQRKQPLEAAKQAYAAASAAAKKLEANPNDADASETLGKYLCFVKNRWDAGLPHLLRAGEVKLRVVATIDLESSRSPQDTLSLADQYWEMASDYKQPFTRGLHLRAAHCYRSAQNTLPNGLEKLKAQKRIDEVGEIYGKEVLERALAPPGAPAAAVTID